MPFIAPLREIYQKYDVGYQAKMEKYKISESYENSESYNFFY